MHEGLRIEESTSTEAPGAIPLEAAREIVSALLNGAAKFALIRHERRRVLDDQEVPTERAARRAYDRLRDRLSKPFHIAMRVPTGVGKSNTARQAVTQGSVRAVAQSYAAKAKAQGLPHRVLFLVPTHALGEEARLSLPEGITTALLQSRKASDVTTGEPLCLNPAAVEVAEAIGADVERTACRKPRKGAEPILCPFYSDCGYQKQKLAAKKADIVFGAHQYAYGPPSELVKDVGIVVIDESFWQSALSTTTRIAVDGLAAELNAFPVRDQIGVIDGDGTAHLADLIGRLQRAIKASPEGEYLTKAALLAEGLLPSDKHEEGSGAAAAKLEWRRKVNVDLSPSSSEDVLKAALKEYRFLGQLPRRAAMWRAVEELLSGSDDASGRLRTERKVTKEGSVLFLRLNGRRDIHESIVDLPVVVLDATLNIDILKFFFPKVEIALDLNEVEAPHQTLTQVVGLPVGKASLSQLDAGKRRPEEEQRVANKRERLVNVVRRIARGRSCLVITNKDLEEHFGDIGPNIEVAHFNAIEGIDRWRNVDVLITIGRPLPSPKAVEDMAAALTGKPVVLPQHPAARHGGRPEQMIVENRPIRLKGGAYSMLGCRVFELSEAELIRQAVTEAAVIQAIGRARGVNRSANNPVEIYMILQDTTLPVTVDVVTDFADLEPSNVDLMAERGMVPQWGADAAKLYPDIWPSTQAAKKAYQRAQLDVGSLAEQRGGGHSLIDNIYKEMSPTSALITFKPAGNGQRSRLVLIDPAKVRDSRFHLEAVFGELALFKVIAGSLWRPLSRAGKRRLADRVRNLDRSKVWAPRRPYVLSTNPKHRETIFARSYHGFALEVTA